MTHKISRRTFLKTGLVGAVSAAVLSGCNFPQRWVNLEPYVVPPEEQLAGQATWYASTCRMCPAGCGIIVRVMNGRALKIEGNPLHPLNRGKLCARGQAGVQLLYNPDRLNGPAVQAVRGSRSFQPVSWNNALNTLYSKVQDAGSGVAVWLGSTTSGHVYDLFKRFTGAIGAPDPVVYDLFTGFNGYSAMGRTQLALYNQNRLPVYDLARADVVFSFGANFLGPWLSQVQYGVDFGRFRSRALGKRGYLVQFEPRMTISGVKADKWHGIKPGSEGMVAQAIVKLIADHKLGSAERSSLAAQFATDIDINAAAAASDIPADELMRLAQLFAGAEAPLAIPGNSLSGQENGSDGLLSIELLNLVAGNAGKPGGVSLSSDSPLSGLANPNVSTFSDVQALLQKIEKGEIKVLLVSGANPIYDLPASAGLGKGFKAPFVVSFNPMVDDTAAWADMIMPDRTYLESWGYEVASPGYTPMVSGQQPVVTPVFDTRSTADIILDMAKGIAATAELMPWTDEVAFIQETLDKAQIQPGLTGQTTNVAWGDFLKNGGWWPVSFAAEAANVTLKSNPLEALKAPAAAGGSDYPYHLSLYLSEFLSDGRGANLPWLQGSPDPMTSIAWQTWVEVNKVTAGKLGVTDGDVVTVTSKFGQMDAPVYIFPGIREDTVAIPLGQGHSDYGRYAQQRGSNPMNLVGMQADQSGNNLLWANQQVQLTRANRRVELAVFEDKVGITEGIPGENFPGQ